MATAMDQQSQSRFFDLPAELRNRVYELIYIQHPRNDEPGLFFTCRRVREEGLKLYYATHFFFFAAKEDGAQKCEAPKYHHFLTKIGAERAAMIEHLRFEISRAM